MLKIKRIVVGQFFTNCYLIWCTELKKGIIVDPGAESEKIKSEIERESFTPQFIVNTHGHFDHIGENDKFGLPVYIHDLDYEFLKNPEKNLSAFFSNPYICKCNIHILKEGDVISIGEINLQVIHTPGHTPGSICLKGDNFVLTGDTLFAGGIGRTDFPEGNEEKIFSSIKEKLLVLPEDTRIFPGHGDFSTIGQEKKHFL